jgi:hypothetical protein
MVVYGGGAMPPFLEVCMQRQVWESIFTRQLKEKLGITPDQIKFHWKTYFNQGYTTNQAIAHLEQLHELYPQLGILPESAKETAGTTPELSEGLGQYIQHQV